MHSPAKSDSPFATNDRMEQNSCRLGCDPVAHLDVAIEHALAGRMADDTLVQLLGCPSGMVEVELGVQVMELLQTAEDEVPQAGLCLLASLGQAVTQGSRTSIS